MEILDCVAFLLVDGRRFLAERRKPDRTVDPGAIAIPGGHLEPGEGPIDALHRELREELGVTSNSARFICTLLNPSEAYRKLHYYGLGHWSGDIENNEAAELLWLSFGEIDRLDLAVDHVAISEYQRVFGNH